MSPSGPKTELKSAQTNQICLCPSSNSIVWGQPSLIFPRECLCHVRLPCQCPSGPYQTFGAKEAPLRPKNAQTNQICLCPHSNCRVRGHPSLKSPGEYLCHVRPPCRCLGGPYQTLTAWSLNCYRKFILILVAIIMELWCIFFINFRSQYLNKILTNLEPQSNLEKYLR